MIWNIIIRGTCLCFGVSLLSLAPQILALGGSHGLYPIRHFLQKAASETNNSLSQHKIIQSLCLFFQYPTLFWIFPSSDKYLTMITYGAGLIALGGMFNIVSPMLAIFIAWLVFLSMATMLSEFICFPWDYLLLEIGFAILILLSACDDNSIYHNNIPLLTKWPFYVLFWRLMLGMGKIKFRPSWRETPLYIKHFLLWQPLPTSAAACLHFMPRTVHSASLQFLYLVEIVLPIFVGLFMVLPLFLELGLYWTCGSNMLEATSWMSSDVIPNDENSISCSLGFYVFYILVNIRGFLGIILVALTVALQFGIALCGNYGIFNILTIILSICFLDEDYAKGFLPLICVLKNSFMTPNSFLDLSRSGLIVFLLVGQMAMFPYCSWCFQASWQSDQVCRFCSLPHKHCTNTSKENSDNLSNRNYYHLDSRLLALQIWLARHMSSLLWLYEGILGQYHLMSGYGVFPVKLQSKLSENRLSFSIKAQHPETLRWHSYKPRYYPSSISAALLWFAPHQPRIDHALYYEGMGERFGHQQKRWLSIKAPDRRGEFIYRLMRSLLLAQPVVLSQFTSEPLTFIPRAVRAEGAFYNFSPYKVLSILPKKIQNALVSDDVISELTTKPLKWFQECPNSRWILIQSVELTELSDPIHPPNAKWLCRPNDFYDKMFKRQ